MKNTVATAFKKLLGKGRAWLTPKGFTDELYNLLASPFEELKEAITNLKNTHFPTTYVDENNIINGEELFSITDIEDKTLEERAANIENQWSVLLRKSNYKAIETILQGMGFDVQVIENIPQKYSLYGSRVVGNGFITTGEGETDPVALVNLKHTFIVKSDNFYAEDEFLRFVKAIVKNKPAHNTAYFIPRYLRKKEIHQKITKREMQAYFKKQYCDCRVEGEH